MNRMNLPEYIRICMKTLEDAGHEVFVVGGAVRDFLLGREIHDYDLATDASPDEMTEIFAAYPQDHTGLKHGTLRVILQGTSAEITTYRRDDTYADHRHPDQVHFSSSLQDDCARRDLTINAMAWHPDTGIRDFYRGQEDLCAGIIRTVGDPVQRFDEDALRILRAVRFAAELSFSVEEKTHEAILTKKEDLNYVAPERLRSELYRILQADACPKIFRTYAPVLSVFLSGLGTLSEETLARITEMLEKSPKEAILRAALILSPLGEENAVISLKSLRPSNAELAQFREYLHCASESITDLYSLRHLCSAYRSDPALLIRYYCLVHDRSDTEDLLREYEGIQRRNDCVSLKQLAVSGSDLREAGIPAREIGKTLLVLLDHVMKDRLANSRESLLASLHTGITGDLSHNK